MIRVPTDVNFIFDFTKVSDRDIQNLNDQHHDQCQIKQPECILFGQPGSHLLRHF